MAAAPATPPKGKRRTNPLLILGIVGGGAFAYIRWKRSKANAAAAAAVAPVTDTTPVPAASYGNASDLSSLLPYLQAQGNAATTTASGVGYSAPTGQVLNPGASGYSDTGGGPVLSSTGSSFVPISGKQAQPLYNSGVKLFWESGPGIFNPFTPGVTKLGAGSTLYQQVPQ